MQKPLPWPHQAAALQFLEGKPAAMLAMTMGSGKSRVAIDLLLRRQCRRVLILAPASIVDYVWPQQLALHAPPQVKAIPLSPAAGGVKKKLKAAQQAALDYPAKDGWSQVFIVNYESAWREPLQEWLRLRSWDLLILDESHRIKAPGGKAARFVHQLSRSVPNRLALTGTPMTHSPLDLWSQVRALDPDIFEPTYQDFRDRYALWVPRGPDGRGLQIVGYKNTAQLHARFNRIAFQFNDQSALNLPDHQDIIRPLGLSPAGAKAYRELAAESQLIINQQETVTAQNAMVLVLRLQQLTSGFAVTPEQTLHRIDHSKQQALGDLLADADPAEPIIVFARFRADFPAIAAAAQAAARPCYELSGRKRQLAQWQADPEGAVLAVQLQAGSLGVDLTRARTAVYYSLDFNLGNFEQSKARLRRPGQTQPTRYYYLTAEGTIDQAVLQALQRKKNLIQEVMTARSLLPE